MRQIIVNCSANVAVLSGVLCLLALAFACSPAGDIPPDPANAAAPRLGEAVATPDYPTRSVPYGLLAGRPSSRIVKPGVIRIEFETFEPVPPPTVYLGLNTLDEELDYPRFRTSARAPGAGPATDWSIDADFRGLLGKLPETPYENRVCWRVEVFLPSKGTARFFEGRNYFNPETLGDTVNITIGPFVEQVMPGSAVFFWETDRKADALVHVEHPNSFKQRHVMVNLEKDRVQHEVTVTGFDPGTRYRYSVESGNTRTREYAFTTPGGEALQFAAMVDSREGVGGGMLNFYGVEGAALQRLGADAYHRGANFILFPGDLVNGYTTEPDDFRNQLNAFRQAMAPVGARIPIYEGMGNHEALLDNYDDGSRHGISMDKPGSNSAEAVFAEMFANPENGPADEGPGSPAYGENVYHFDWGNTRIFVLNNNYWWSSHPSEYGGNLEGYILPNQMTWLRDQVAMADADPSIRHLFFAAQEPPFPNGGHTQDAMWYNGGDTNRDGNIDEADLPIVENRNEMWSIISASTKTVAFITGDEHAYSRIMVTPDTDVGHKRGPDGNTVEFANAVWQVTSGGAGAPFYDKELDLPWSGELRAHSTQPHYAFFRINGDDVLLEAYSKTGQKIDEAMLRRDGGNTGE